MIINANEVKCLSNFWIPSTPPRLIFSLSRDSVPSTLFFPHRVDSTFLNKTQNLKTIRALQSQRNQNENESNRHPSSCRLKISLIVSWWLWVMVLVARPRCSMCLHLGSFPQSTTPQYLKTMLLTVELTARQWDWHCGILQDKRNMNG